MFLISIKLSTNGKINLPALSKVKVINLTLRELTQKLEKKYEEFFSDDDIIDLNQFISLGIIESVSSNIRFDDVINDFNPLEDFLALSGNLTFEDLTFEQGTGLSFRNTLITIDNGRLLAILVNVPASIISEEDFVDVSQP